MWAIIENNVIVKTIRNPKAVSINDIQYPKTIFSSSWTDAERKAIGILPYVFEGVSVNNMFYTTSESSPVIEDDRIVVTRTKTEIDIDVIKNNMLSQVTVQLNQLILLNGETIFVQRQRIFQNQLVQKVL
jgi:hypothetical protein